MIHKLIYMAGEIYWINIATIAIAVFSLIISIIAIKRDKVDRGYERLHEALVLINKINLKITEYMGIKKISKKDQMQIESLTTEYINQYCYLAFLINNRQIDDFVAYRMGRRFILKVFRQLRKRLNKREHKEIFLLVKRWEKYPPTNLYNRLLARILGYY